MVQWTIRCIKRVIKLEIKRPSANEIKESGIGRKTENYQLPRLAIQTSGTPLNKHD
jgi:hypothetical protein